MKQLSNSDYDLTLRLLRHLSAIKGESIKDKEMSRKAGLMVRKMERMANNNPYGKNNSPA